MNYMKIMKYAFCANYSFPPHMRMSTNTDTKEEYFKKKYFLTFITHYEYVSFYNTSDTFQSETLQVHLHTLIDQKWIWNFNLF
jgi:hypothetical protein